MIRVLVADDDRSVRLVIKRMLQSLRCEVVEATDGVHALDRLSKGPFSLAILDLRMPLLDGMEVLQAIRTSPQHATLPVIIVSGAADKPTVMDVASLGVTDFLAKPFRFDQFKMRLMATIQEIERREPAPPARPARAPASVVPENARPVLLVDTNAEFRQFAAGVLGREHVTVEAKTGQEAVSVCASCRPVAVVAGPDTGIFGPALLARKLRNSGGLTDTRMLLVATPDQAARLGDTSMFDAVIGRTFDADDFAAQFGRAMEMGDR